MYFSKIVRYLTKMFKGGSQEKFKGVVFTFTTEARIYFLNLCKAFTTVFLLYYFDPLLPIWIEIDISGFTISAIFLQAQAKAKH